jgi:phosphatidylserine/phosphatidylglycerophosphate/cardiolipin synthase-like enzyme
VRVGSTDFNVLGVQVNYELDAVIQDTVLAAAAERMFEEDLANSTPVMRRKSGRIPVLPGDTA